MMSGIRTYARAALPLLPGASRLPFVAGGGGEMPELERRRENVGVDRDHLSRYARVCGFPLTDTLPPTYPHVLAFELHMELLTDGRFPFPAVGLVHLENEIDLKRPISADEILSVHVRATAVEPHPKGQTFSLITDVRARDEIVWVERSTMLRRGEGNGAGAAPRSESNGRALVGEWRLAGDLGRRYGAVSGDRNPIHIHPLTARLFGFPRAIAHGMWSKARCLAAFGPRLPDSYVVDVEFRKPVLLPGHVALDAATETTPWQFALRDADRHDLVHLEGTVRS